MRIRILLLLLLAGAAEVSGGKLPPLTVNDVSLMLRSGYSAAAVEQETVARHFMGAIDATAEKNLSKAGASPTFIAALKSGAYAVPPEEAATVQKDIAEKAQRKAVQAEEARKLDTLYQYQLAQKRNAPAPAPAAVAQRPAIVDSLKGALVSSKNGALSAFDDQKLEKKKLIGLYFAGSWCPNCRKFTPELVAYYNRVAAAHPEFEIVFMSRDRSAAKMEAHMRDTQMPWPAVSYDKLAEKETLRKYAGNGVPCLVVVDAQGRVVSDTYAGKTYRGPSQVLGELDQIFAKGSVGQVALQR